MGASLYKVGNSRKLAGVTPTVSGLALLSAASASAQRTSLGLGASDTPTLTGLALVGGTVTSNTPLLNLSQTWNNAGVTFEGITLNVTDAASNSSSALINLSVNNSSYFKVNRDSTIDCVAIKPTSYLYLNGNSAYLSFNSKGLMFPSIDTVGIDVRNGVTGQAFNIYNTWGNNGINYERLSIWFATGNAAITTQAGGTGVTTRHLYLGTGGAGTLFLQTNNTVRFQLASTTGHLLASADNTYDIGTSGANRPRHIYAGTDVVSPKFVATSPQTYAASNVTTDRTYDANATTIDELADIVGTLISDLQTLGLVA